MPPFSTTKLLSRLAASPRRLISLHRIHPYSTFSGDTTAPSLSSPITVRVPPRSYSIPRWVSGIAAGSSLGGALYWYSDWINGSGLALADGSGVAAESGGSLEESVGLGSEEKRRYLFGDEYRRKVFFKYEKRIRTCSSPEKVFEYFASFENAEGELLMTPADLMRAVVPVFPPSESSRVREGSLKGERNPSELRCAPSEFFMLFDLDNDGLISFNEYLFFVTLLSIPESSFSVAFKMFDIDNNGEIDRVEFKKVMDLMRSQNRQGASHTGGLRPGIKLGRSIEDGGLVEYFFGKDGKTCLQHDKFVQFLRDLHSEIVGLEFAHYDYKSRESISAKDFALSMIASADIKHLNKLLRRVGEIDKDSHISNIRISEDEFRNFAELRRRLQPFSLALFSYGLVNGLLTKDDFQRAASQVCGVTLTNNVVDVVFHVFDANRDGNLSVEELVRVLEKREKDIARPVEDGFFSCCWSCINRRSISRILS